MSSIAASFFRRRDLHRGIKAVVSASMRITIASIWIGSWEKLAGLGCLVSWGIRSEFNDWSKFEERVTDT